MKDRHDSEYSLNGIQIGKRIRDARLVKHYTQSDLAELCDCTDTHICNVEKGKIGISLDLLYKVSIILDKSMDYFLMDHESANTQVKINELIVPKLSQCDTQMLNMVQTYVDGLITYRNYLGETIRQNRFDAD